MKKEKLKNLVVITIPLLLKKSDRTELIKNLLRCHKDEHLLVIFSTNHKEVGVIRYNAKKQHP